MTIQTKELMHESLLDFYGNGIFYPESDGEPMAETDIHRDLILNLIKSLEFFFAEREDVYVTGNIMFYYVEGVPAEVVAPDVMVCFGIPKGKRTSYKTWEENDVIPSVIIEVASSGTWKKDRIEKKELYEMLGVKEYYIFNPKYPKTLPAFLAYKLNEGILEQVNITDGKVTSDILGLDLIDTGETLRLYNAETNEFLKTTEEFAQAFETVSDENQELKAEIEKLKKLLETQS